MTRTKKTLTPRSLLGFLLIFCCLPAALAGYKARPWSPAPVETYPARLKSEGVTIAAVPFSSDELAAEIFDKKDMVTRGIMPLAIVIFNDNDFPVTVESASIELICGEEHTHTMPPGEVVYRLFRKGAPKEWVPQPMPKLQEKKLDKDALEDFSKKFLGDKEVAPHKTEAGFLYLHVPGPDTKGSLGRSRLYIPNIYRGDNGERMIFFEIELQPCI